MSHIFISYSHKDSEYAHQLAKSLEEAGFEVWIDGRIDFGTEWPDAIEENLESCAAFVVIMSANSRGSTWVKNELSYAQNINKPIFPLLLAGDRPWLSVASLQYVDGRDKKLPSERFWNILENVPGISRVLKSTLPLPNSPKGKLGISPSLSTIHFEGPISSLPEPLEWCDIPSGKVMIEYDEKNKKIFEIPAFQIAKYPITNAQYQAFIDAQEGYADSRWWDYSEDAKKWRVANTKPKATSFPGDYLPRTNVSWFDAVAFSRWLSELLSSLKGHEPSLNPAPSDNVHITLPTEPQWQWAAVGDTGWAYPWGNSFDVSRCNTRESEILRPTQVTQYPNGANPYGVMDMSGNVWEWCLTEWGNDSNNVDGNTSRVLRGGSWDNYDFFARAFYRNRYLPSVNNNSVGFRCVRPK